MADPLLPQPPLPLPPKQTEASIQQFFSSIALEHAPRVELQNYWKQDWRRFVYTYGLVRDLRGHCLELGANPYFTTMLLRQFTSLDLTLCNYFGPTFPPPFEQRIAIADSANVASQTYTLTFHHFNVEQEVFPFTDNSFDVVLFCEVIEHLQNDPVKVLCEIKRILQPGGYLILTTPNVNRLENVCRMIAGANIYDPYSGYGPYGRHNREYNKHELARLLHFCGFEVEELFSADVHHNHAAEYASPAAVMPLVRFREQDLGQYLFSRSRNSTDARSGRPSSLYRSYSAGELVE